MPYFKGKRRKYISRKPTGSKTIKKIARKEAKMVLSRQVENKIHDYTERVNVSENGYIINLMKDFTSGVNSGNLVGDEIYLKSVELRVGFTCAQYSLIGVDPGDPYNDIRLIIFRWHDINVFANATDILNIAATQEAPYAMYNHANRSRYTILYDKMIHVENIRQDGTSYNQTGGGYSHRSLVKKMYGKSLGAKKIIFQGEGGFESVNGLYALIISDSSTLTQSPMIEWHSRVIYEDA